MSTPLVSSTEQPSLNELVLRIAEHQDKQSFADLFHACSGRLKAYAIRCGANDHDAEEIVQEALATVWHKAHQFNPATASAITWLYTIVRNKRIDFARKTKNVQVMSDDLWPDNEPENDLWQDSPNNDVSEHVESDLNAQLVRTMIEALPQEQRQIVYKVYFEGKSHSEIAEELDLPLGTIKSRLRLAMKKLDALAKEQMSWLIIILLMNY